MPEPCRPAMFSLGPLRFYSHYLKYFGPSSLRRQIVKITPLKNLRKLANIVDQIHNMSKDVFESKKAALAAGDAAVTEQVGEGKDIMSILRKQPVWTRRFSRSDHRFSESQHDSSRERTPPRE